MRISDWSSDVCSSDLVPEGSVTNRRSHGMSRQVFVIVGASLAGLRAAEALRSRGFDGRVVLIGEERHAPYERPPLSKAVLHGTVGLDSLTLRTDWDDIDVEFIAGDRAVDIDVGLQEVTLASATRIRADQVLLAPGGLPADIALRSEERRVGKEGV